MSPFRQLHVKGDGGVEGYLRVEGGSPDRAGALELSTPTSGLNTQGYIVFQNPTKNVSRIIATTPTASDSGELDFQTAPSGGSLATRLFIDAGGVTVNGGSAGGVGPVLNIKDFVTQAAGNTSRIAFPTYDFGTNANSARIDAVAIDNSQSADLRFFVRTPTGAIRETLSLPAGGGVWVNPSQSPTNSDLLVDGGNTATSTRVALRNFGSAPDLRLTGTTAHGTVATPAATQSGDLLLRLGGAGYTGTQFTFPNLTESTAIDYYAAENWSNSSIPGYMTFRTTPSGATWSSERMRITASGQVGIGTTQPSSTFQVMGSIATGWRIASSDITLTSNDAGIICDTTGGLVNITLPLASGTLGRTYLIAKKGGNGCKVVPSGSDTLGFGGDLQKMIATNTTSNRGCEFISDGTSAWMVF